YLHHTITLYYYYLIHFISFHLLPPLIPTPALFIYLSYLHFLPQLLLVPILFISHIYFLLYIYIYLFTYSTLHMHILCTFLLFCTSGWMLNCISLAQYLYSVQ